LGFVVAPGAAAFVFSSISPLYAGLPNLSDRVLRTAEAVSWVVYPIAVILGIPLYLGLKGRVRPSAVNLAIAGAAVAATPWLALSVIATPDEASTGDVITVHHHLRTLVGWLEELKFVGEIALFGAFAGLMFWACISIGNRVYAKSA
jgi:hypothetical protein